MSSVGFPLIVGHSVSGSANHFEETLIEKDSDEVALSSVDEAQKEAMDKDAPIELISTDDGVTKVCIKSLSRLPHYSSEMSAHMEGSPDEERMLQDNGYIDEDVHNYSNDDSSQMNGFECVDHDDDVLAVVDFDGEVVLPTDNVERKREIEPGEPMLEDVFESNTDENISPFDQRQNIFSTDLYEHLPEVEHSIGEINSNNINGLPEDADEEMLIPEFAESISNDPNQCILVVKQEDDGNSERNIFESVNDNTTSSHLYSECIPPLPSLQRMPFVNLELFTENSVSENASMEYEERHTNSNDFLSKSPLPKIKMEPTEPPQIDFFGQSSIRNIFEVFNADHDVKSEEDKVETEQSPTKNDININVGKKKSVIYSTLKELQHKYPSLYKEKANDRESSFEEGCSNQETVSELSQFISNVSVKLEPLDLPDGITMNAENSVDGSKPESRRTDSNFFSSLKQSNFSLGKTKTNTNYDFDDFSTIESCNSSDFNTYGTGSLFTRNNNEDFVPDFDEIDDIMFISFSTLDSLEAHVEIEKQTQQPRNKHKDLLEDISNFKTKSKSNKQKRKKAKRGAGVNHGYRGINNKILLYERMLCEELGKRKHHQMIHPDLKKAGLTRLSQSPDKRYNLDKLGVKLDIPKTAPLSINKTSTSKPKATSRKKSSKSIKLKKPATSTQVPCTLTTPFETVNETSEPSTSHSSLTADPGKVRLPVSESKPFKPFELPLTSKTSAFVSKELDEYLDKLQDISSVLTDSKLTATPVSYFHPDKPQSYVRTLDMVLNRRKKNNNPSNTGSTCDSLVYPSTSECDSFRNKPSEKLESKKKVKKPKVKKTPKKVVHEDSDDPMDRMQKELLEQVTCTSPVHSDSGSETFYGFTDLHPDLSDNSDEDFNQGFENEKSDLDSPTLPFCGKAYCKLGCLCGSIEGNRTVSPGVSHCRKIDCMFGCTCDSSLVSSNQNQPIFEFQGTVDTESIKKSNSASNLTRYETSSRTRTYISRPRKKHCSCINRRYHMHDHLKENKLKESAVPLVVYQIPASNGSNQLVAVPAPQVRKEPVTASEKLAHAKKLGNPSNVSSPLVLSKDKMGFMLTPVLAVPPQNPVVEPPKPKPKSKKRKGEPQRVSRKRVNKTKQFHFTNSLLAPMQKGVGISNISAQPIQSSSGVIPTTFISQTRGNVLPFSTTYTNVTATLVSSCITPTVSSAPLQPLNTVSLLRKVLPKQQPTVSGFAERLKETSSSTDLNVIKKAVSLPQKLLPKQQKPTGSGFAERPKETSSSTGLNTIKKTVSLPQKVLPMQQNPTVSGFTERPIVTSSDLTDLKIIRKTVREKLAAIRNPHSAAKMNFIEAVASSVKKKNASNTQQKILIPIDLVPRHLIPKDPLCIQLRNPIAVEGNTSATTTTESTYTIAQSYTPQLSVAEKSTIVLKETPNLLHSTGEQDKTLVVNSSKTEQKNLATPQLNPTFIDLTDDSADRNGSKNLDENCLAIGVMPSQLPIETIDVKIKQSSSDGSLGVDPASNVSQKSNKSPSKAQRCIDKVVRCRSRFPKRPWQMTSLMVMNKTLKDKGHPVLIDINSNENWQKDKSVIVSSILQSSLQETISTKVAGFTVFLFYSDKTRTVHLKGGNAMSGKHNVKVITVWVFVPKVPIKLSKRSPKRTNLDKMEACKDSDFRNDDDDCKVIGIIKNDATNTKDSPNIVNCAMAEIQDLVSDSENQDKVAERSAFSDIYKNSGNIPDSEVVEQVNYSTVSDIEEINSGNNSDRTELKECSPQRKRKKIESPKKPHEKQRNIENSNQDTSYQNNSNIFEKMELEMLKQPQMNRKDKTESIPIDSKICSSDCVQSLISNNGVSEELEVSKNDFSGILKMNLQSSVSEAGMHAIKDTQPIETTPSERSKVEDGIQEFDIKIADDVDLLDIGNSEASENVIINSHRFNSSNRSKPTTELKDQEVPQLTFDPEIPCKSEMDGVNDNCIEDSLKPDIACKKNIINKLKETTSHFNANYCDTESNFKNNMENTNDELKQEDVQYNTSGELHVEETKKTKGTPHASEDLLAQSIKETYEQWHKIINGEQNLSTSVENEPKDVVPKQDPKEKESIKDVKGTTFTELENKECLVDEPVLDDLLKHDDIQIEEESIFESSNNTDIVKVDSTFIDLTGISNNGKSTDLEHEVTDNYADLDCNQFIDVEGTNIDTEDLTCEIPVVESEPIEKLNTVIDIDGTCVPLEFNMEDSFENDQNRRKSGRAPIKSWKLAESQTELEHTPKKKTKKKKKSKDKDGNVIQKSPEKLVIKMVYGEVPYIHSPPVASTSKRKRKDLGVERGTLDQQLQKLVAERSITEDVSSSSVRPKQSKIKEQKSIVDVWRLTDEEVGVDVAPFNESDDNHDDEIIDVEGNYEIKKPEFESDYNIVEERKKQKERDLASWKPPSKNIICDLASGTLHPPSGKSKKGRKSEVKGAFHDMSQFLGEPQFMESVVACVDDENLQPGRLVHNIKERQRRHFLATQFKTLKEVLPATASSKQAVLGEALTEIIQLRNDASILIRKKSKLNKKHRRLKKKFSVLLGLPAAEEKGATVEPSTLEEDVTDV
ncbi:uncharacterized protein [Antedon mediterranea]|uniref:uncharacterized protein n=1 Tax=Antedon mediterranea TaxID=105859 RepID=UPI003AF62B43